MYFAVYLATYDASVSGSPSNLIGILFTFDQKEKLNVIVGTIYMVLYSYDMRVNMFDKISKYM